MKKKEVRLQKLLGDWYKPTKKGEQAREYLMHVVVPHSQVGAVGEEVDKKETPTT